MLVAVAACSVSAGSDGAESNLTVYPDGGVVMHDGGISIPDASVTPIDGGVSLPDGGFGPVDAGTPTHRVHSLLPHSEAQTLQGIADRLVIRPMACSSTVVVAAPVGSGPWRVPGSGDLTEAEGAALALIFARLEAIPSEGARFDRADHTECFPQDGSDVWRVEYEQD
jgi:hypothetical protein